MTARRAEGHLFNAEVTSAMRRLFEGLELSPGQDEAVQERLRWGASLLASLSYLAVHFLEVASQIAQGNLSEEEKELATPETLLQIAFLLAEERGWTI